MWFGNELSWYSNIVSSDGVVLWKCEVVSSFGAVRLGIVRLWRCVEMLCFVTVMFGEAGYR